MTKLSLPRSPSFEWWQTIYPDLKREPGNETFPCVFHNETRGRALSLRVLPNGNVIAHCFGACGESLWERVEARFMGEGSLATSVTPPPPHRRPIQIEPGKTLSPLESLSVYTGVSVEFLRTLDLAEVGSALGFIWPGRVVTKLRQIPLEAKSFEWSPPRADAPPFWPRIPDELPSDVFITEGETDCIVIRSLDVPAFALTKGAGTPVEELVFEELQARGCKTVFLIPDVDKSGRESALRLTRQIRSVGLEAKVINLAPHLRIMEGEKDLRALYLRVGRERLQEILESAYLVALERTDPTMSADEVLSRELKPEWLAPALVAKGSITLLSGQPKAGKTTFVMKLTNAFAKGESFLNRVCKPANVLLLTENRSVALQAKLELLDHTHHVRVLDRYRREFIDVEWADLVDWIFDVATLRKIDVIVLDTFMAWAQPEDENSSTEILFALDPLSRAVQRTGIALIIVHHLNKDGSSPRGSGVFEAEVDTTCSLTHARGGARRLAVRSNIVREPIDDITFSYDGERYQIVEDIQDPFDQSILATLEVLAQPTTLQDLLPELDQPFNTRSLATLRERVKKLVEAGLIDEAEGERVIDPHLFTVASKTPNISLRRS